MTTTTHRTTARSSWYPIDDAAKALGVSRRTVQRRVAGGHLRSRTQPDGTSWVEVPVADDRQAERLAGLQAIQRNEAMAERLVESHQQAVEVYRQRVADLQVEVQTRGRWLRWAGGVAAASVLAVTGLAVVSILLASKQGATEGHLQATVTQLDQARGQVQSQEVALRGLQADLAVARQGATAASSEAEMSRQTVDQLRVALSQMEQDRDRLAEEMAASADAADWVYLLTGFTD